MSIFRRKTDAVIFNTTPPPENEVRIELEQTPFNRWKYHVRTYNDGRHISSYGTAHTGYSSKGIALDAATVYNDVHSVFDEADKITVTIKLYDGELLEWFGRDNDHI